MAEDKLKIARRLAAQDLAKAEIGQARNPIADFGSGANETLIAVAGYPVDLTNKLMGIVGLGSEEPIGGSAWMSRIAQESRLINSPELPENGPERFGKIFASAVPGIGVVGGLARASSLAVPILQGFRNAPKTFAALEAVSAAGAGIGGEIGRTKNEVGEIIGQILGGVSSPYIVTTLGKFPTFRLLRRASRPFTKGGAKQSGAEVVQRGVNDRQLTVSLAEQADILPEARKTMSLGAQAGSSRLIALEKAVAKKLPELSDDMARNEAETNIAVKKALESRGDIDNTVSFFETQRMRVKNALNARMAAAVQKMDESIANLKPNSDRADASRVISRELEDALSDARFQEKDIWEALPGDEKLGLTATRKVYDEYVTKETPVPSFVKDALKGKKVKIKDFKDVRELRSRILRMQKSFRAQGNAEEAFILQKINEGILDDIMNTNLGPDFSNAVDFSRTLNQKFTRGPVGNLLRFSSRGGRAVSPELVSEDILSTTAPKAANSIRAVRAAVGSNEALEGAILDSVKNRLFKTTGDVDASAVKRFVEQKGELLDELPELKQQLLNAENDVSALSSLKDKLARANSGLIDRRRSAAAIALGTKPENSLNAILNSPNRRRMLSQAVRVTKKDPDAFEGLQDAYTKELFKVGQTARDDAFSNKLLSGRSMRTFFEQTKDDAIKSGLYTKEEISRLNTIINTAERLEKATLTRPESAEIISSEATLLEDFIVRVIGANIGAKFASGSGAPFVAAYAGSRMMRTIVEKLPFDRVTRLLGEAVKDPDLMKDLLTRPTTFTQQAAAVKRLNAWIATLGPYEEED